MPDADRDFLADYLAERDEPCPSCRYSLKGLQGNICPECGEALTLRVGHAEPGLTAWVFGLVGISSGFGVMLLIHALILIDIILYTGWIFGIEMLAAGVGLLICSIELWAWTRHRGRICRMNALKRWVLAVGLVVLALSAIIVFIVIVVW